LNREHLKKLKRLVNGPKTPWYRITCWGSVDGTYTHDLLPMPYTHAVAGIRRKKSARRAISSKFPSASKMSVPMPSFTLREMTEWEFLTEVAEMADCGILLDVNNTLCVVQKPQFQSLRLS